MPEQFILALDQGTTSSRAILFDQKGQARAIAQQPFPQYLSKNAWVEHDALEIWETQLAVAREVLQKAGIAPKQVVAIGITNQRETTVAWDRQTGQPLCQAIVWQDRRTAPICDQIKTDRPLENYIRENTGLVVDAYFSGTKLKWILDNVKGARQKAEQGKLLFGTIDSWLIYKLTHGQRHLTDFSNASRTLLFNINTRQWDDYLLEALTVPRQMLPEVRNSSGSFGLTHPALFDGVEIPIMGVAGDQQAALFGQGCLEPGMAKNTYGTGCFLLMNTGPEVIASQNGLITTIAWGLDGEVTYALEGSIFIAGAAVQWLRDGLQIIDTAQASEALAREVDDAEGVYVVPAFAGLGAPYWDMYARGAMFGLTRSTTKGHLARATLDSLAYQTRDVLSAMQQDAGLALKKLRADGGAAANDLLMQFQADILGVRVERPQMIETTAFGAACLAGIATGFYQQAEIAANRPFDRPFDPAMSRSEAERLYSGWQKAVQRAMGWVNAE